MLNHFNLPITEIMHHKVNKYCPYNIVDIYASFNYTQRVEQPEHT